MSLKLQTHIVVLMTPFLATSNTISLYIHSWSSYHVSEALIMLVKLLSYRWTPPDSLVLQLWPFHTYICIISMQAELNRFWSDVNHFYLIIVFSHSWKTFDQVERRSIRWKDVRSGGNNIFFLIFKKSGSNCLWP